MGVKIFFSFLLVIFFNLSVNSQCVDGETEFTWEGTGSGNQMVWSAGQNTGSDVLTDCSSNINVNINVIDTDNVWYNGTQDSGSSSNGFFGTNGLTIWLDNDENLYNNSGMSLNEEASLSFDFSIPVSLKSFTVSDIDWRNNAGVSSRWRDKVLVTALDENENNVPLSAKLVDPSSTITITGQTATADYNSSPGSNGGLDAADPEGQVIWSSNGLKISKLVLTYIVGVQNAGQQAILVNNFQIDVDSDDDGVLDDVDKCEGFDDAKDRDNDTVPDACDDDDDNDGILDEKECGAPASSSFINMSPNALGVTTAGTGGSINVTTDVSSQFGYIPGSIIVTVENGNAAGSPLSWRVHPDYPTKFVISGTVPVYINARHGTALEDNGDRDGFIVLDGQTFTVNSTAEPGYQFSNNGADYYCEVIDEDLTDGRQTMSWSSNGVSAGVEFYTTNARSYGNAINFIIAPVCDTDKDGIPDSMDTDSDDDGCPDAIEGDGTIIDGLSTLTGGSPTADSSSENLGTNSDAEGNPLVDGAEVIQDTAPAVTDDTDSTACTADLMLTKVVNQATPKVGGTIIYTLMVTNNGPLNATGVQVTDVLPTGITYSSDTPSAGTYSTSSNIWNIGNLDLGSSVNLQISATVDTVGVIVNTAEITQSNQKDIDSIPNSKN